MKHLRSILALTLLTASSCGGSSSPVAEPIAPSAPAATSENVTAGEPGVPAAHEELVPPALRLPDHVQPKAYNIELALDPAADSFGGTAHIDVELSQGIDHLWLHGTGLTIEKATLTRGPGYENVELRQIPAKSDHFIGFKLPQAIGPGPATLSIAYRGSISSKDYSGLFRQEDQGNSYLYSQFEAFSARKAFPAFDEPRWKVPFTLTLQVPAAMQAFSNTAVASVTAGPRKGWKTVAFKATKPLPSYLVALAVGPFEIVDAGTAGRNKTPVRIIATKGNAGKVAYARRSTVELQGLLEEYFDIAYPYAKLDHIAVPHFLGAMENPGLITYDSGLLFSKPGKETMGFQRRNAGVVAHELAHQWFGDLVTLAWWNDTWINEAFATWASSRVVDQWKPTWNGLVSAVAQRNVVMKSDGLITARKIRQPIKSHSDIAGAFDGITYQKGAAVLWMFEQAIGPDKFKQGVRSYLRKHMWKTATADDFLASIGEISDPGVPAAFRTFLDQPGIPLVTIALSCTKTSKPTLQLSQARYLPEGSKGSSAERWQIPVCVEYENGKKVARRCTMLKEKSTSLELSAAKGCPRWVLGNADSTGYYRVAYKGDLLEKLMGRGAKQLSVAEQLGVIGDLNALVKANAVSIADALNAVPKLTRSKNRHIIGSAAAIVNGVDDRLLPKALWSNKERFVRKTFGRLARRLGWLTRKGDDDDTKALRRSMLPMVAVSGADKRLQRSASKLAATWLRTGKGIDDEMLDVVLSVAAYNGDAALYQQITEAGAKAKDESKQRALIGALGAFRGATFVKKNLDRFLNDKSLGMRESFGLMGGGMRYPETRQMVYDFVKTNHVAVMDKLPMMARGYIVMVARGFCDEAHRDDFAKSFGPFVNKELQGEKMMAQTLEAMDLCIAFKKAQGAKVAAFFKGY